MIDLLLGLVVSLALYHFGKGTAKAFSMFMFVYYVAYLALSSNTIVGVMVGVVQYAGSYSYWSAYYMIMIALDLLFALTLSILATRRSVHSGLAICYLAVIFANMLITTVVAISQASESQFGLELHAGKQATAIYVDVALLIAGAMISAGYLRAVLSRWPTLRNYVNGMRSNNMRNHRGSGK